MRFTTPCKQCIVVSMCKVACPEYNRYMNFINMIDSIRLPFMIFISIFGAYIFSVMENPYVAIICCLLYALIFAVVMIKIISIIIKIKTDKTEKDI